MNCETARERLDVTRPDGSDRNDPDLQEEFAHIGACTACEEVYERRQEFDREIARAMQEVPTPDRLKSRILESLESAAAGTPAATGAREIAERAPTRRAWFRVLAGLTTAALLLLAGIVVWPDGSPQTIAFADLVSHLEEQITSSGGMQLTKPESKTGVFDAASIDGRWSFYKTGDVRGVDVDGDGELDAAVYSIRTQRGAAYLVVASTSRITNGPTTSDWKRATPQGGPAPRIAWTSGDLVYICFEDPAQADTLRALLDDIDVSAV